MPPPVLVLFSFPFLYLETHGHPRVVASEETISVGERQVHGVMEIDIYLKLLKGMLWTSLTGG